MPAGGVGSRLVDRLAVWLNCGSVTDEARLGVSPIVGDSPKLWSVSTEMGDSPMLRSASTDELGLIMLDELAGRENPRELRSDADHCSSGAPGPLKVKVRWTLVVLIFPTCTFCIKYSCCGFCAGRMHPGPLRAVLPKPIDLLR